MKTAEDVLNEFTPMMEYPSYYHESNVIQAMEKYKKQHAFDFTEFRDTFKRYESQEMHIFHQKIGGLTTWYPISDERIYEAFLRGEQRPSPLIKDQLF